MFKALLTGLILSINMATSQELPCLVKREVSPQETGIVDRYLDQCSQEHVTFLNTASSEQLFKFLGKEEVKIKISTVLPDLYLTIQCKVLEEKQVCLLRAPILNFGMPLMGMGDYDPEYWMAKFHSQFFLRDKEYIFSPRQEYIVSLKTGASDVNGAFNNLLSFNFEVLDSEKYATVSIFCEDVTGDGTSPRCSIIF